MNLSRFRGIDGKIKTRLLGIYLILAVFLPFYSYTSNVNNVTFILPNIILILILLVDLIENHGKIFTGGTSRVYLNALSILFIVSLYCNIRYNGSYWVTANRAVSLLFIAMLVQTEQKRYPNIIELTINIMCIAVVFSLVLRLAFGIDCIYLQNGKIGLRYVGSFYDQRMTYVFVHKSGYGLVLLMLFILILRNPYVELYKCKLILVAFAIIVTNSAISIAAMFICSLEYYTTRKEISRNKKIIKVFLEVLLIVLAYIAYIYFSDVRDVSSAGGRFFIWQAGVDAIKQYPHGIGNQFYTIMFTVNGHLYNNFHNTFLNEMIHYSVIEGIVYSVITCIPFIIFIKNAKKKSNAIWFFISVLLVLSFDNTLHDSFYSLFMFLGCLIGFELSNNTKAER